MKEKSAYDVLTTAFGAVLYAILLVALCAVLLGFPLMWAWNHVIPGLFGLPEIDFLKAVCLHFVAGLLVKGSTITKRQGDP